ncbi:hypothetical protein D3C72_2460900 [compost metagenome]
MHLELFFEMLAVDLAHHAQVQHGALLRIGAGFVIKVDGEFLLSRNTGHIGPMYMAWLEHGDAPCG